MLALVVAALLDPGSLPARAVWTIPWGLRDGAPDLASDGRISIVGVQRGEDFVRGLAARPLVLVGGGQRVPMDIAEYPHIGDGYTEAVLVPRRPLLPRTVYRLAIETLEERTYLTGPGPDGSAPEWTGEPSVAEEESLGREHWVTVVLPSATAVPFARVTLVCAAGAMMQTRCHPTSGNAVRIAVSGCSGAIIELLDGNGKVSAPRRVAIPAPRPAAAWPGAWIGLLTFVLAPFVAGHAAVRLLLRRRARRRP